MKQCQNVFIVIYNDNTLCLNESNFVCSIRTLHDIKDALLTVQ